MYCTAKQDQVHTAAVVVGKTWRRRALPYSPPERGGVQEGLGGLPGPDISEER